MRKFLLLIALIISGVGFVNAQNVGDNTIIDYGSYSLKFTVTSVDPAKCSVTCSKMPTIRTSIEIPSTIEIESVKFSVTTIGSNAFNGCTKLLNVDIPNTITNIGSSAFKSCSALTSVSFEKNSQLTSIGSDAFQYCSVLTSMVMPNTVSYIGYCAFQYCSALTNIKIPKNVSVIENRTFDGCSKLTIIRCYAENVPTTGTHIFNGCPSNMTIYVPKNLIETYKATSPWNSYNIDELPESLEIGQDFIIDYQGYSLKYIITSVEPAECEIAYYTTTGDFDVSSITLPSSVILSATVCNVTSIGDNVFSSCTSLSYISIPNSITHIGDAAFLFTGLTSISIPSSVTSLGENVFVGCYRLSSIKVDNGNTVYDSRNGCNAIIKTSTNELIRGCKNTVIPNDVTSIGYNAFNGCDDFTSISIPSSVTSIGAAAFSGCSSLKSVKCYSETVPELTGNNVFQYNHNDLKIFVPVVSLGAYQMDELWKEYNLQPFGSIGDFVEIGYAYHTLKYTITSLEPAECEVVCIQNMNTYFSVALPSSVVISGKECSVTSIGAAAFSGRYYLSSISIPNTLNNIGNSAFSGCSNLTQVYCHAKNIPTTGSYVFSSFSNMTIYVPATLLSSYKATVPWSNYNVESLTNITDYNGYSLKYTVTNVTPAECEVVCSKKTTTQTSITIPSVVTILGAEYNVTSIGNDAFMDCSNVIGVSIPNSIKTIGNYAFYNCYNINNIVIPNSVTTIGSNAFYRCNIISIPNSVTSVGDCAFQYCNFESNSVRIPNCLKSIGNAVFSYCSYLKSVDIPNSVETIGSSAFSNCSNLSSVTFGENSNLTSISGGAFRNCTNLSSIDIPNSVETIESYAFAYSGLRNVTFGEPSQLTSIGDDAFYHNYIQTVVIPSSVTSVGQSAFTANNLSLGIYFYRTTPPTFVGSQFGYPYPTIYVPSISLESYKNAENMTWYSENITGMPTYTSDGWIDANGNVIDAPETIDHVAINAPMVLSGNTRTKNVLTVNSLGLTENGSLTIKDGAQLIANKVVGEVTVEKNISGYQQSEAKWYTIASPLKGDVEITNSGLTDGAYDLYRYDEPTFTWENYKYEQNDFTTLESGRGYLYANAEDVTLKFTGAVNTDDVTCSLTADGPELTGFHLIGNPFTHDITFNHLSADVSLADGYYVLDGEGAWGAVLGNNTEDVIKVGQAALIKTTADGALKISKSQSRSEAESQSRSQQSTANSQQLLNITVSNANYSDKAFVVFDKGVGLDKINHENENIPLLYIPQDGTNYAIAMMDENVNEIPVNFEAKTMGQYTISLRQENCEFEELYLLDKETGNKVNILEEDYTFIATTADDAERFVLLKNNGQQTTDNGHFAYISGEDLIINVEGAVQIIDMMGRVVYSIDVTSDNSRINVSGFDNAAYIIRVVNEEGVKVQKIMVY